MVYGANVLANWLYSLEVFHAFHGKQPSFLYQRFSIGLSIVHFNNFKRIERTIHSSFQDKTAFSRTKRHFRALRWCWKVLNGSECIMEVALHTGTYYDYLVFFGELNGHEQWALNTLRDQKNVRLYCSELILCGINSKNSLCKGIL